MDNFEILEKLLNGWKADLNMEMRRKKFSKIGYFTGGVDALESALKILKRPSNTQSKFDGLPCWFSGWCEYEKSLVCHEGCEKFTPTTDPRH